jgi:hypothetical protein
VTTLPIVPLHQLPLTATEPDQKFRCVNYRCGMEARHCLDRQDELRRVQLVHPGRVPGKLVGCSRCKQGANIRALIPDYAAPSTAEIAQRREERWQRLERLREERRKRRESRRRAELVKLAEHPVICAYRGCGKSFAPQTVAARYCGPRCKKDEELARGREHRRANPKPRPQPFREERVCVVCSDPFTTTRRKAKCCGRGLRRQAGQARAPPAAPRPHARHGQAVRVAQLRQADRAETEQRRVAECPRFRGVSLLLRGLPAARADSGHARRGVGRVGGAQDRDP